jgi:flagellar biosynthesis anti-sigma factor FlgM
MEIRKNAEGLQAFLGVSSPPSTGASQIHSNENAAAQQAAFAGDQATLSHAGTELLQAAAHASVRTDRVTAIQQAIAAGTYDVDASAVAGKVMDAMLGASFSSGH